MNVVMKLLVPYNAEPISFSRRTLLREVDNGQEVVLQL